MTAGVLLWLAFDELHQQTLVQDEVLPVMVLRQRSMLQSCRIEAAVATSNEIPSPSSTHRS
jgi:hypothetical protein